MVESEASSLVGEIVSFLASLGGNHLGLSCIEGRVLFLTLKLKRARLIVNHRTYKIIDSRIFKRGLLVNCS